MWSEARGAWHAWCIISEDPVELARPAPRGWRLPVAFFQGAFSSGSSPAVADSIVRKSSVAHGCHLLLQVLVWKEIRYGRMSEKEKSMLVSEVNILRELKHPNIVRYKVPVASSRTCAVAAILLSRLSCASGPWPLALGSTSASFARAR